MSEKSMIPIPQYTLNEAIGVCLAMCHARPGRGACAGANSGAAR